MGYFFRQAPFLQQNRARQIIIVRVLYQSNKAFKEIMYEKLFIEILINLFIIHNLLKNV